jgi:hypothetical protein
MCQCKKNRCLDRGSNTGPLDLQSNALPTELSKQLYKRNPLAALRHPTLLNKKQVSGSPPRPSGHSDTPGIVPWWYSVVVSISGCDPLDPGSNPGTAIRFCSSLDLERVRRPPEMIGYFLLLFLAVF